MNTWTKFWVGLDLFCLIRNLLYVSIWPIFSLSQFNIYGKINVILMPIVLISCLFSAYFIYHKKKIGFVIYFFQVPFRIYYAFFSFTLFMECIFSYLIYNPLIMFTIMILLESIRVIYSLRAIRKFELEDTKNIVC